mgnify:CR=1 FL=1
MQGFGHGADADGRGDEELAEAVRRELGGWWGSGVQGWRWLRTVRVPMALPVLRPLEPAPAAPLAPGLWTCGDHRESASIHGALRSGRRVAEAILS